MKRVFVIVLALFGLSVPLVACTEAFMPVESDLQAFSRAGRTFDMVSLERELAEGKLGASAEHAIIPLLFMEDGSLVVGERARTIFARIHHAASEEEATEFLDAPGVSLYFTTPEPYTAVLANMMAQGRETGQELRPFVPEAATLLVLDIQNPHEAATSAAYVFNPHVAIPSPPAHANLDPAQNPDCLVRCSQRCARLRIPALVIACFLACAAFC